MWRVAYRTLLPLHSLRSEGISGTVGCGKTTTEPGQRHKNPHSTESQSTPPPPAPPPCTSKVCRETNELAFHLSERTIVDKQSLCCVDAPPSHVHVSVCQLMREKGAISWVTRKRGLVSAPPRYASMLSPTLAVVLGQSQAL